MTDRKGAAAGTVQATYPVSSGNRVKLYALGSDSPDGSSGAFFDLANAINAAKHFIFIADWSFQPFVRLGNRAGAPNLRESAGALLNAAANDAANRPGMLVAVHVWDHTSAGAPDDQNDGADTHLDAIAKEISGGKQPKRSPNLLWRKTSRAGVGNSIHQKFVVLDADVGMGRRVVKAFFGGLDLTKGRFDFGDHPVVRPINPDPKDPTKPDPAKPDPFTLDVALPSGSFQMDDWYNAEFARPNAPRKDEPGDPAMPRQPWQDFYAQMIGPAAWDILREFVGRWNTLGTSLAPGPSGNISDGDRKRVRQKFLDLFDKGKFVQAFEAHAAPSAPDQPYPNDGGPFQARVVRSLEGISTATEGEWGEGKLSDGSTMKTETPTADGKTQREFVWKLNTKFESSIQRSYVNAIANANRFIYIETQYFIGSGEKWAKKQSGVKNQVPESIVKKIVDKIDHDQEFHAYVVIPMFPEGAPDSGAIPRQRFFEFQTMSFMALEVAKKASAKKKDWREFLSFYFVANWTPMAAASITLNGNRATRVQKNRRYQIYVHSKLMIIDDEFLIVGSANLNERSLAGDRDTEICVWMSADEDSSNPSREVIKSLRRTTWTQHLGAANVPADFDDAQKASCALKLQSVGDINWTNMAVGLKPDDGHLIHFPFDVDTKAGTMFVRIVSPKTPIPFADQDRFIFDAPATSAGPPGNGSIIDSMWAWSAPKLTVKGKAIPDFLAE